MTEAKDYPDFLEQHRLMDDAQKYPLAVEYARSCEREIVTLHEERDRLRAALTYYAEPRNHHDDYLKTNDSYDDMKLPGSRARAALEGRE